MQVQYLESFTRSSYHHSPIDIDITTNYIVIVIAYTTLHTTRYSSKYLTVPYLGHDLSRADENRHVRPEALHGLR